MRRAVAAGSQASAARAGELAARLGVPDLALEWHRFPDGESGVRVMDPVPEDVVVLADLADPDAKFLPLAFLLDNLRDLGARKITLVAPYLPYLRQDKRFREGEALTSKTFAQLLSPLIDRLITVDPHLHRYRALEEIYAAQGTVLSAAAAVGEWIRANLANPLLVGPDSESEQWVSRAASVAQAPCIVLQKRRHGDRSVDIHLPARLMLEGVTPVLVDDIVSSGQTMAQAVRALRARGSEAPVCIGVHGLFADEAFELLREAGAVRVLTSNTVVHATNAIDVFGLLAEAVNHP